MGKIVEFFGVGAHFWGRKKSLCPKKVLGAEKYNVFVSHAY